MSIDSFQSVYREKLLEHLLIGELLKYSWQKHDASLEVSQPSIDRSGHDIVLEANGITRHVQLKTSSTIARTGRQNVHLGLGDKPSGCVVWVRFDPVSMELGPFLFFDQALERPCRRSTASRWLRTQKAIPRASRGNGSGCAWCRHRSSRQWSRSLRYMRRCSASPETTKPPQSRGLSTRIACVSQPAPLSSPAPPRASPPASYSA